MPCCSILLLFFVGVLTPFLSHKKKKKTCNIRSNYREVEVQSRANLNLHSTISIVSNVAVVKTLIKALQHIRLLEQMLTPQKRGYDDVLGYLSQNKLLLSFW